MGDRIARMFTHHDHCDKAIVTTVTIHTGACAFAAATNVQHCAGDVATSAPISGNFLAKFTWNGNTGERGTKTAGTQVFPEYEAGIYAIVYETKDQHFTSKACRQIENVDHTHPIIQILGSDVMTLEATHQATTSTMAPRAPTRSMASSRRTLRCPATSSTSRRWASTPSPTTARIRPTTPPRPPPAR